MKVLTRLPDKPVKIFGGMTAEKKLHNDTANKHAARYCDKKCPSGPSGMATWHDENGECWECEFNPYNMEA